MVRSTTKEKETTGVNKWEKEMADAAIAAAEQESGSAGGEFFSLRGGRLTFNDAPLPDNQMAVVIVDGILENVFYPGAYDPDKPQAPSCFAFGRDDKELKPHEKVTRPFCDTCAGCPNNEWGSADTGKGKACSNTRRLAMIAAGTLGKDGRFEPFEDLDHFQTAQVAYMKLPVTSVKGYATFVKQLAGGLKRPPYAVFTKVKVIPDGTTFKVTFEALAAAPADLIGTLVKRHQEVMELIEFPYTLKEEEPARSKGKAPAKPVAKRKY